MMSIGLRRASFVKSIALTAQPFRYLSSKLEIAESVAESLTPDEFRKKHQIVLSGASAADYPPVKSFSSSPFSPELRNILVGQGYDTPTPIQAQSWPIILDGKDIISVARTGSGKTVGFLLPAMQKLLEAKKNPALRPPQLTSSGRMRRGPSSVPTVLVLAPTRELTVQIEGEASKYCTNGIRSLCVYGGTSKGPQVNELRNGVDIVVATPGRCNDLNIMGALDLSQIKYLVLDEADRMLDMGFEPQIREIVDQLPEDRQTVFFTATWPKEVQALAKAFLINPVQINVGDNDVLNANKKITQNIVVTNPRDKLDELFRIIESINTSGTPSKMPKTLIFTGTKSDADFLVDRLEDERYPSEALHGDKSQALRDKAMDRFRAGRSRILVATDVAARGLDVKDIETVINYDFPSNVEDYVHRIGRTARGENTGIAYSLLTQKELSNRGQMKELVGILERCNQEVPEQLLEIKKDSNTRSSRFAANARGGNRYASQATASSRGNPAAARGFSFSGFGDRSEGGGRFGAFRNNNNDNSSGNSFGRGSMTSRFGSGGGGGAFNKNNYINDTPRGRNSGDRYQDDDEYNQRNNNIEDDDYAPRFKKTTKPKFNSYVDDDDEDRPRRKGTRRDRDYDDY